MEDVDYSDSSLFTKDDYTTETSQQRNNYFDGKTIAKDTMSYTSEGLTAGGPNNHLAQPAVPVTAKQVKLDGVQAGEQRRNPIGCLGGYLAPSAVQQH